MFTISMHSANPLIVNLDKSLGL